MSKEQGYARVDQEGYLRATKCRIGPRCRRTAKDIGTSKFDFKDDLKATKCRIGPAFTVIEGDLFYIEN